MMHIVTTNKRSGITEKKRLRKLVFKYKIVLTRKSPKIKMPKRGLRKIILISEILPVVGIIDRTR